MSHLNVSFPSICTLLGALSSTTPICPLGSFPFGHNKGPYLPPSSFLPPPPPPLLSPLPPSRPLPPPPHTPTHPLTQTHTDTQTHTHTHTLPHPLPHPPTPTHPHAHQTPHNTQHTTHHTPHPHPPRICTMSLTCQDADALICSVTVPTCLTSARHEGTDKTFARRGTVGASSEVTLGSVDCCECAHDVTRSSQLFPAQDNTWHSPSLV